jgi:hypothetical protein
MQPFRLMWMWPILTRVNKPENDAPSIVEPIDWQRTLRRQNKRQPDAWSRTQRFALRRFLDFRGEALRETTVF